MKKTSLVILFLLFSSIFWGIPSLAFEISKNRNINYVYDNSSYVQVGDSIVYNHGGVLYIEDFRVFIPKEIYKVGEYELEAIKVNSNPIQMISSKCEAFEETGIADDSEESMVLPSRDKIYYSYEYAVIVSNGVKNVGRHKMLKKVINNEAVSIEAKEDGGLYLKFKDSTLVYKVSKFKYPNNFEDCSVVSEQGKFKKIKSTKRKIKDVQLDFDYYGVEETF